MLKDIIPFGFLKVWISDVSNHVVVQEAWNNGIYNGLEWFKFLQILNDTSKALKRWNRDHFGYAYKKIAKLEQELKNLQEMNTMRDNGLKYRRAEVLVDLRT